MKVKMLQFTPSTCYEVPKSTLNSVMGQDFYDVGQYIADLGETDKSQQWVWAVGNI